LVDLGGCTVTLVKKASVKKCIETIKNGYKGEASFYEFEASDGARAIDLKKANDK
jgi:galactokinase